MWWNKTLALKDQPSGKCIECRWNGSANDKLDCSCPQIRMINTVCMQKINMVLLGNVEYYLDDTD